MSGSLPVDVYKRQGLRRSELLALRWENIDMEKKIIHVRESVSETGTGLEIHPCKSIKSIRDIPFDDELHAIFSKMQRSGFVIKGQNGKNVNPHNLSLIHILFWFRIVIVVVCHYFLSRKPTLRGTPYILVVCAAEARRLFYFLECF